MKGPTDGARLHLLPYRVPARENDTWLRELTLGPRRTRKWASLAVLQAGTTTRPHFLMSLIIDAFLAGQPLHALIAAGADINLRDDRGRTCLMLACSAGAIGNRDGV